MFRGVSPESLPPKAESWKMFDRIAPTYDRLNRLLSGGIDGIWRRRLARFLPEEPPRLDLLDAASGTGDQLLALLSAAPRRFASATGADPAARMLEIARAKPLPPRADFPVSWVRCHAEALPFPDASFDVATMSFGIRNIECPRAALEEIRRVLRPAGRALILEFSIPANRALRAAYLAYFRHVLPRVGGWISGEESAYRYLNRTVEEFPAAGEFLESLRNAGFGSAWAAPFSLGISTLYIGNVAREEGR